MITYNGCRYSKSHFPAAQYLGSPYYVQCTLKKNVTPKDSLRINARSLKNFMLEYFFRHTGSFAHIIFPVVRGPVFISGFRFLYFLWLYQNIFKKEKFLLYFK